MTFLQEFGGNFFWTKHKLYKFIHMYTNLCSVVLLYVRFVFPMFICIIYWFSYWKWFWKLENMLSKLSNMTTNVLKLIKLLFLYQSLKLNTLKIKSVISYLLHFYEPCSCSRLWCIWTHSYRKTDRIIPSTTQYSINYKAGPINQLGVKIKFKS